MGTNNPIRLDENDLFSPKVEAFLEEQAALRRAVPEAVQQPLVLRILYSSYFYLSLAGAIGAFLAWMLLEPHLHEGTAREERSSIPWLLLFPTVAAGVGLLIGAAEGLVIRNFPRALLSASVGLGIGFVGGLIALFPAGIVFAITIQMVLGVGGVPGENEMPKGFALLLLIIGRGICWAIAAIPAGLGQGIALREKKVVWNGLLGAVLGGLLGGLLFDPIGLALKNNTDASLSRAVGFSVIGVMVGLFIGLVEQWTKNAWLLMKAGPLAGKQFIIYRNPTVIGSSPKADIYIFKDAAIEPRHALLHNRGGRFEIEDCGTKDGTYVNGVPITRKTLQAGDQIVIGKTMFEFSLKESR